MVLEHLGSRVQKGEIWMFAMDGSSSWMSDRECGWECGWEAAGRATEGKEAAFPENSRNKTSCLIMKVSAAY